MRGGIFGVAPVVVAMAAALGCGPGAAQGGSDTDTDPGSDSDSGEIGEDTCGAWSPALPTVEDPEACDGYSHAPAAIEIEVVFVNETDGPIYLPDLSSGCDQPRRPLTIEGEHAGARVELAREGCAANWPSCPSLIDSVACDLCATVYPPQRIEPGGRWSVVQPGPFRMQATLPGDCVGGEDQACWQPVEPPPGTYVVQAFASEGCVGACDCEPDADGSCALDALEAAELSDVIVLGAATWTPGCDRVELRFPRSPW